MRFTVFLFFIALLPVMMLAHWWDFEEHQQPRLRAQVEALLKNAGVRGAAVDLRYLDLTVTGDAPDEASLEQVRQGIAAIGVLRLVEDRLSVLARLKARIESETLHVEGWLPDEAAVTSLQELLKRLRPDLEVDVSSIRRSTLVRMPEGERLPLKEGSALLRPILELMKVPSRLEVVRREGRLKVSGMVPTETLRTAIVKAIEAGPHGLPVEAEKLRVTPFAQAAAFTQGEVISTFLRSFYSTLAPGDFQVEANGNPSLTADATRTLESAWLTHLRPLTQGRRAEMKLSYFPSRYHFPGRRLETALPEDVLQTVRDALAGPLFRFEPGSAVLSPEVETRLASLVPVLLSAGPSLKLIIGGHPDPAGELKPESALALRRAERVVSFLIEQGTPSTEILPVAFDPVPVGTKHAPAEVGSVEILIH